MKRYGYHRTSTREVLQNIGIPATRLQSQTVCTPCLNLMIADVSNMSRGGKNPVTMRVCVLLKR